MQCSLNNSILPFQVLIRPSSKVIIRFLTVMMKHGYIGEFEIVDDHRSGKIMVNLTGRINKCQVIRFSRCFNAFSLVGNIILFIFVKIFQPAL